MEQKTFLSYNFLRDSINCKPVSLKFIQQINIKHVYFSAFDLTIFLVTDAEENFDFILVIKAIDNNFIILDVEKI